MLVGIVDSTRRSHRGVGGSAKSPIDASSLAEPTHRLQFSCSQSSSACETAAIWLQMSNAQSIASAMPGGNRSPRKQLRIALILQDCWIGEICYNISFRSYCQLSPGRA